MHYDISLQRASELPLIDGPYRVITALRPLISAKVSDLSVMLALPEPT
jgi:hypothetical protein